MDSALITRTLGKQVLQAEVKTWHQQSRVTILRVNKSARNGNPRWSWFGARWPSCQLVLPARTGQANAARRSGFVIKCSHAVLETGNSQLRVEWKFPAVSPSTATADVNPRSCFNHISLELLCRVRVGCGVQGLERRLAATIPTLHVVNPSNADGRNLRFDRQRVAPFVVIGTKRWSTVRYSPYNEMYVRVCLGRSLNQQEILDLWGSFTNERACCTFITGNHPAVAFDKK